MFFTPFKYIDYTNYKYYILTSNFHEWPRENSFLQYQENVKQTIDEKKISIRG